MDKNIYIYVIIFITLIVLILLFSWAGMLYSNFKKCEESESSYCPQMFCDTSSNECKSLPYRKDENGKTVCAKYLLSEVAPIVGEKDSGQGGGSV